MDHPTGWKKNRRFLIEILIKNDISKYRLVLPFSVSKKRLAKGLVRNSKLAQILQGQKIIIIMVMMMMMMMDDD